MNTKKIVPESFIDKLVEFSNFIININTRSIQNMQHPSTDLQHLRPFQAHKKLTSPLTCYEFLGS